MKSLDGESWARLEPFHLSIFRSMHARRINFSFLHVLAQFWDPQKYIFRFNAVELCPLPEEFEAILGCQLDSSYQITIPHLIIPDIHSIQLQMARMFDLAPQFSLCHIFNNEVLTNSLLEVVVAVDNKRMHWFRMMALCLYAQFLLVSASGNCNPKILSIIDQVEAGLNPFPLILAETIIGLDNFAETRQFSGSPLLLEVSSLPFPSFTAFLSLFSFSIICIHNLHRHGFTRSWGCWNLLEIFHVIGPNIVTLGNFILSQKTFRAG